ncbi:hypothetical protein HF521_014178 [Silurus meridionalis]|uniref:Little elongation complex subunit 1 C-terminal domain-containing protein n=1 Tax=Silurus meridionalis TaxID=175797 RepID=A0A8T0ACE0_SILME|nr:hypothetical protein HF521_014178 [Silurus meridionalis]
MCLELKLQLVSPPQLELELQLVSPPQLELELQLVSPPQLELELDEPPGDTYRAITSTLKALLKDKSLTFQKSSWYGDDLCPAAWDYVFSLDLLCAQLGWIWTVSHVIRKSVWLILNTWLKQTQTEETQFRNVSVAAIFRLLGRLGQNGLKENVAASVEDLVKSITEFRGQKDLPWEVQLAVVYATHDLAPSNPKVALNALQSWKKDLTKPVPPAVPNNRTRGLPKEGPRQDTAGQQENDPNTAKQAEDDIPDEQTQGTAGEWGKEDSRSSNSDTDNTS